MDIKRPLTGAELFALAKLKFFTEKLVNFDIYDLDPEKCLNEAAEYERTLVTINVGDIGHSRFSEQREAWLKIGSLVETLQDAIDFSPAVGEYKTLGQLYAAAQ